MSLCIHKDTEKGDKAQLNICVLELRSIARKGLQESTHHLSGGIIWLESSVPFFPFYLIFVYLLT